MKAHELGLNSEFLTNFRMDLDMAIRSLVNNLTERSLETGTVNAKIKVTVKDVKNDYGMAAKRMEMEPSIAVKVGASGKMSCEKQDNIYLQYDEDGTPIIGERQIDIDEYIRARMDRGA